MPDYQSLSFWLDTVNDDLTPRPPLEGPVDVDVAIVGGGYTGLWTAWYLLEREPSLNVAIVEAEIAGYGASGRNGGWCFSGFPVSPLQLLQDYGYDTARRLMREMHRAVDEVGRVAAQEGIDAHYVKSGALEVARGTYDLPRLQKTYDEYRALGLDDHYELLDARQVRDRMDVAGAVGGFRNKEGATVHPANLARGLARAVERRGATIYEQTRVTDYTAGASPSLITDRGTVRAKAIVFAGEGYLSAFPGFRRKVIPITSHMVVTEPLPDSAWEQIRWHEREVLGGTGVHGAYINHTRDGRIALGAYRGTYPFRSGITEEIALNERIFAHARESLVEWFPMLKDVRFTHAWGGVIGVPRDKMPTMTFDRRRGVAAAYGYTGKGVATANLSGRVLADLITETSSPLTQLPMASYESPNWEPEPLRWLGVTFVRRGRVKLLEKVEREGTYPEKPTLVQRLYDY